MAEQASSNASKLPTVTSSQVPGQVSASAARYLKLGLEKAPNTVRAYKADLDCYTAWCDRRGLAPFPTPVDQLVNYLSDIAQHYKVATLERRLAMLSSFHDLQGWDSPTSDRLIRIAMDGIRREKGIRQHEAPAFTKSMLEKAILPLDESVNVQLRDKVVLLLGFTGAFRRGELVALNLADLHLDEDGILIDVRRSKTDQLGGGNVKAIFYASNPQLCPVRTLKRYLSRVYPSTDTKVGVDEAGKIEEEYGTPSVRPLLLRMRKGDKFGDSRLTDQSINLIVQKHLGKRYSAHSLRASFVTVAKRNGASNSEIMAQTFHKTEAMIRRYTRFEDARTHNAGTKLGL
ncbi:MAG: tyrosine-type recombinase/integrase [Cyclobacteriaceae bacterium]